MKRTNVVLDDKIVAECMKATGIKTRRAAHPYHSGPHVIGTLHCWSCIRNAEEENTRGDKPVRDSLKTVIDIAPYLCHLIAKTRGNNMKRFSEQYLVQWIKTRRRKPLILRGARQVGKSTLVR
ncbi:MAG: type II toxin-antitoxin system VapB family antitoxin, partial [Proteobacteria bacterium]|nr:type II toxin-antitoxin system VapB family antitoxin [Pseudomonadota bacterium]